MIILKNIAGFNISWFGLVYFGNSFISIAIILLIIHLLFLSKKSGELIFILAVAAIGIFVDSLLLHLNIFIFLPEKGLPFWLMALWGSFAATLCHSLRFLARSLWLQVAAGLVAPLSYIAGSRFEVVEFGHSLLLTYFILGLIWPLLFMLFFYLKPHFVNEGASYA